MDYTLREIPPDIHKAWKTAASMRGESMKDYCFRALMNQVRKDVEKEVRKNEAVVESNH